jgi:hypothetical protein
VNSFTRGDEVRVIRGTFAGTRADVVQVSHSALVLRIGRPSAPNYGALLAVNIDEAVPATVPLDARPLAVGALYHPGHKQRDAGGQGS